jgi:hypothetical protein
MEFNQQQAQNNAVQRRRVQEQQKQEALYKEQLLYRWIPHNSGFGFLDIAGL